MENLCFGSLVLPCPLALDSYRRRLSYRSPWNIVLYCTPVRFLLRPVWFSGIRNKYLSSILEQSYRLQLAQRCYVHLGDGVMIA
jgi:hypothetical protein